MTEGKIVSYLGFSIKAGKLVFGLDNAEKLKRGCLLLYGQNLADNSKKHAQAVADRLACPVLIYRGELGELLHRPGCKVAVVTDRNLADAIVKTAVQAENFSLGQGNGGNH